MTRVVFEEEARAETLEAFRRYEEKRPGLGSIFRGALDVAVRRIRNAPLSYAIQHRDLRRALVQRFPYAVFYRITPDAIVVVGVIHGRKHPRAWQRR